MEDHIEQEAEGLAVTAAVLSGACDRCPYLSECEAQTLAAFPPDAWCSQKRESYVTQLRRKRGARYGLREQGKTIIEEKHQEASERLRQIEEKNRTNDEMWHRLAKLPGSICRFCTHYKGGSPKCDYNDCGGYGRWDWNGKTEA